MKLVIPDALPPLEVASALTQAFEQRLPQTVHLLNARRASAESWPIGQHGCTATEGLALEAAGYQAPEAQPIGAGLGPLHAKITHDPQPVWLAQLTSTAVRQEGAALLPCELLELTANEVSALQSAAEPYLTDNDDGIWIEPLSDGLWRVHASFPAGTVSISPQAVSGQDLGDWWPTEAGLRSWRKRVNEIQMAWHEHPVNQARDLQGKPPINSLWLYGGARAFEPKSPTNWTWVHDLTASARRGDWSAWLDAWAKIEPSLIALDPADEIVLTNDRRLVRLSNAPQQWWRNLFSKQAQDNWRDWWLNNQS